MDTNTNDHGSAFFRGEVNLNRKAINSIQGNDESDIGWIDHGIVEVPTKVLPLPDGVQTIEDFNHHISWEDAKSATLQLPEIQKAVISGKSGEEFSAEDQKNNLDWSQGKRRTFDLFYGMDPIEVDKIGDQYTIVSGRHRIFAAKELGLETIPCRLREKLVRE